MTIQSVRALYAAGLDRTAVEQLLALDAAADAAVADAAAAQSTADGAATDAATAQSTATTAQTTADTAQTTATAAQTSANNAGTYFKGDPALGVVWTSDNVGIWPPSETSALTLELYDTSDAVIATHIVSGFFSEVTGNIILTDGAQTGLTSVATLIASGTMSTRAEIEFTFADGSKKVGSLAWSSVDATVAGLTPASGGGK
jgi:hypothetical protein